MNIRNGEYLDKNQQPISSFYDLLSELKKRLEYDEKTHLFQKHQIIKELMNFECL